MKLLSTHSKNISSAAIAAIVLSTSGLIAANICCDTETIETPTTAKLPSYYGTLEPWASEAIYFLVLDRFVDGDSSNNHEDQGGDYPTWDRKLVGPNGEAANVGYLGGDFQGVMDNLDYIRGMGLTAIWTTPIMDNPDEAFRGGEEIEYAGKFKDGGKTGYHGYWIDNFFVEDEHYVSPQKGLDFEAYANALHAEGLKVVFDIVANHCAPAFSMPEDQPKFGKIYDKEWNLIADHQNLHPEELDPSNPLHSFFYTVEDFMQLPNINDINPDVIQYFTDAYLSWIDKGADAIRIDTIRHVKHSFWKAFSDNIRRYYPGYFMFGESFVYDANFIAQHTLPKNGNVSVLDFPGQEAMVKVFENPENGYDPLEAYLHLTHGPYDNAYDLVTFYDNHDMARIDTSNEGYIDANNWLFTTRGIPCIYYGSEMAFMRGKEEHGGNRNYYGQEHVNQAKKHPIYKQLSRIAHLRQKLIALQKGLQVNVELGQAQAVFYRIYQHNGVSQSALVMLNKSDQPADVEVTKYLQTGTWVNAESGSEQKIMNGQSLKDRIEPHSFSIWTHATPIRNSELIRELQYAMQHK